MKTIATGLGTHIAGEVTTLCTCWLVTLTNGTVYAFTDHDENVIVDAVTYVASSGYDASEIQTSSDLSVDNLEITGFLDSPVILEDDLEAGRWDYAAVNIFRVNYASPSSGKIHERRGTLGEVTMKRGQFQVELRGLLQALARSITELYSPGCRARLGDTRCAKDLTDYTASGTVGTASSDRTFTTNLGSATVRLTPSSTGTAPDDYFKGGMLTWLTGANAGLEMEVKQYTASSQTIVLQLLMPFTVAAGDTFTVYRGCDKSLATCKATFGNVVNFRGEPYVPGLDQTLQTGGV